MALRVEGIVDGGMGGQKPLRRSGRLEALHPSLSLSNRQMGILRPVVLPAPELMPLRQVEIAQRSAIRWQFVGDEGIRDEALFLQQFAHQLAGCLLVSPGLNQDIQHLTFAIDSAPQIHPFAVDGDKHLVEMPSPIRSGSKSSELVCISQTELHRPAPDALVGDIYAAFSEEVFDIPEAQRKPEIEPNCMLDY